MKFSNQAVYLWPKRWDKNLNILSEKKLFLLFLLLYIYYFYINYIKIIFIIFKGLSPVDVVMAFF